MSPPEDLATDIRYRWIRFAEDGSAGWSEFDRETREVF
jgi:hypothetical protein